MTRGVWPIDIELRAKRQREKKRNYSRRVVALKKERVLERDFWMRSLKKYTNESRDEKERKTAAVTNPMASADLEPPSRRDR